MSGPAPGARFTGLRRVRHWREGRPVRHLLAYALCRALFLFLALLPRRAVHALGRACGRLFYLLSARHRRIALGNLERAFGASLSPEERRRLARASFAHAGMILADAARFGQAASLPLDRVAVYEGTEHLMSAVREGRGVVVFSGHYGHWEMIPLLQARIGVPFTVVVRPLENRRLNDFMTRLRSLTGNEVIAKHDAARTVLKALRAGRAVALMIDQNVRGAGGVFVDFFGVPASTTPAIATFALKCGAPIVPVFTHPLPDGRHHIRYGPPIHPRRSTGAIADDVLSLTRDCTALLETEIRRRPEYWLWMHNRWRTRPPVGAHAVAAGGGRGPGALARSAP